MFWFQRRDSWCLSFLVHHSHATFWFTYWTISANCSNVLFPTQLSFIIIFQNYYMPWTLSALYSLPVLFLYFSPPSWSPSDILRLYLFIVSPPTTVWAPWRRAGFWLDVYLVLFWFIWVLCALFTRCSEQCLVHRRCSINICLINERKWKFLLSASCHLVVLM